ncbi:hypothetical protein [Thermococcus sp. 21S7]|uniref:hypothetical protein n=1 Tax=Thermococcus sp. 21S7 TaxID=1638221 RepID=UPI00143BE528|nr:hypothetical protein [Thermococcus sp. 21S7]NJE61850.1 hypothetical protein [Thermococcus sp. 21S7]
MKVNESNFMGILFVDNWVRGFVASVGLSFLFGAFAVAGSFWRVVKFVLVLFPLLSVLIYFALYRSVIGKGLREEGKTSEVVTREADAYAGRAAVVVLFLFLMASILGARFFSEFSVSIAVLLILLSAAILAYLHAKFITPVDIPREPWRISKRISRYVRDLKGKTSR